MITLWAVAMAQVPPVLAGTYDVTFVVDGSEQVPFADMMRRRALAVGDDCFVARRSVDFGAAPEGAATFRAPIVLISEELRCRKGGLGDYAAIATLELPAAWAEGDPLQLTVPGGTVWVAMTRIQKPRGAGAPAQWAAPEFSWSVEPTTYQFRADKAYGKKAAPLRVTDGQTTWIFEVLPPKK
jgi:hypothetical protein